MVLLLYFAPDSHFTTNEVHPGVAMDRPHPRACVGYQRMGEKTGLHPGQVALVGFVNAVCDVPANFEDDRTFGSYSGMCHEDRLVSAFAYEHIQYNDIATDTARALHPQLRLCVREADWAGVASILTRAPLCH